MMSLRRSARVSAIAPPASTQTAPVATGATSIIKKRARKLKEPAAEGIVPTDRHKSTASAMLPPPTTPTKRRRVAKSDQKPPPITPTPSAIGLMTSSSPIPAVLRNYSSGDIDGATPPPESVAVEPHHTNATLVTSGGTRLRQDDHSVQGSDVDANGSAGATNLNLLETACAHLIRQDPNLKRVIELNPCRVFSPAGLSEEIDPFRSLASGIMAQQVSGAAARSIKGKFINLFPPEACPSGFPPPALVAQASIPRLREAGLSQRKAEYIQGLAAKFDTGELTVRMLMDGSDEEVMEKLVAVRGLGVWSVEMFMCFGLKRMDVFSTGDLGVQRGMAAHVGRDIKKLKAKGGGKWKYMSEKEMVETAEKFRPYRSLFMWLMWRVEDVDVEAIQDN
ncbi:DNA glycosylase [Polychaeton citri CBS 116435]|uniref:DNA glycosylase n=1 Tax=Polychaeton citri CBS 116435 TaxID=1314669 RepID=A0A9P4Q9X7_9PEZI|nr:DNA glycosylase [Polychaeton citri CBS 116435]